MSNKDSVELPPGLEKRVFIYLALKDKQLSLDEIRFVVMEMIVADQSSPIPVPDNSP